MIAPLLLSICLLYFSFPNLFNSFGFWPLAWIFALPLFWILDGQSWPRRLGIGFVFGLIFYALLVKWLIPYHWAGYILFVAVLLIQPVLFCVFCRLPLNHKLDVLFVPALWVATEYIRAVLLKGFSWNLAHSQTFNIYGLQTANLAGSWGISFFIILVNYCLYRAIKDPARRIHCIAIGLSAVLFMGSYGFLSIYLSPPSLEEVFNVCAVQPNIDSREKRDPDLVPQHLAQQAALSQHCLAKNKPDLIVWPETAVSSDFQQDPLLQKQMASFTQDIGVPVLLGAALWKGDYNQNSAVLLNAGGLTGGIYYKQYLVPFSEKDFIAGPKASLFSLANHKFAVAICSEDTIGSLFQGFSSQGAGFAVVLLNDGWFKEKAGLVMHGQNSIMRAAENRMPIVRVANTGWTALIDRYGQVKSMHEPWFNTTAIVSYEVSPYAERTLYSRIGDLFAVFCCLFVIIFQIVSLRFPFKSNGSS